MRNTVYIYDHEWPRVYIQSLHGYGTLKQRVQKFCADHHINFDKCQWARIDRAEVNVT